MTVAIQYMDRDDYLALQRTASLDEQETLTAANARLDAEIAALELALAEQEQD